ncbi:MAG: ion channel [Actinobacteria bacterium]|jgi:voltage-gated potassium channel|nr:ion channel [Actinomycetota bacterium]MCL6096007.1 ion channel [Actinomycetota bacterium]
MILLLKLLFQKVRGHQFITLGALALGCVLLGAVLFSVTQHVSIGTSLYWAITTATTVGYGDVTPHNGAGRIVAVGVMLTAVPLFGSLFALMAGVAASIRIRRVLGMDHKFPASPYRVIYGMHPVVPRILEELIKSRHSVVLVADADTSSIPLGVHFIAGDPTREEVIKKSHPEHAEQALVALEDDGDVLVTVVTLRHVAPYLPVSALTRSAKVAAALTELGVERTLSADDLLAHTMAKTLETPHAADLLMRMVDSEEYQLAEIPVDASWVSKPFSEVRRDYPVIALALVHGEEVILGVERDPLVEANDSLLILKPTNKQERFAVNKGTN